MKDTPTYEELLQERQSEWQAVATVREARRPLVQAALLRPWRCPTCGTKHEQGGLCDRCRTARVVELD